jgi:tetraacyldisaccharide 4'-kinase
VFLLDDGFQHARLHRDLDIVLIDAMDPWGSGGVFPLGRLREPKTALSRADVVVITRSEVGPTKALEQQIRHNAPGATLLRSRTVPVRWIDAFSGTEVPLSDKLTGSAFCGLGNPESFWRSLEHLGCTITAKVAFGDHHRYTDDDLARVAELTRQSGGHTAFTTEKDAAKLPNTAESQLGGVRLLVLHIKVEIEPAEVLLNVVRSALRCRHPA